MAVRFASTEKKPTKPALLALCALAGTALAAGTDLSPSAFALAMRSPMRAVRFSPKARLSNIRDTRNIRAMLAHGDRADAAAARTVFPVTVVRTATPRERGAHRLAGPGFGWPKPYRTRSSPK